MLGKLVVVIAAVALASAAVSDAKEVKRYAEYGKPNLNQTVTYTDDANLALGFDQTESYRFLLYSYAAYLTGGVNPWVCSYCTYTAAVRTFVPYTTVYDSGTDAFAFIGTNPQFNEIVISFRGSASITNWILNINSALSRTAFSGGSGSVASGFYTYWKALRPGVLTALAALVRSKPSYRITVTGHSLGGVAASIAATDLRTNYGYGTIYVRTFGEPRIGDSTFASFVNSKIAPSQLMRMTHNDDIVVHLPPATFGFDHETTEVWNTASGYKTCSSTNGEDGSCSYSVHFWSYSVSDHLSYMGVSCCKGPNLAITLPEHLSRKDRMLDQ